MKTSDLPLFYNAVDILEHNLLKQPEKIALYSDKGNLSFQEISSKVNQVGNALKNLNVHHGEHVAIIAPDCAEWAITFFATLKVGAVATCISTLLMPDNFMSILNDCRARVVIVHEDLFASIQSIYSKLKYLEHLIVISHDKFPAVHSYYAWHEGESKELAVKPTHREDYCMLHYSSGTTGEPKGVLHAHKDLALCAELYAVNILGLQESDRTFAVAKLFFIYGTGGNLIFPWYTGAGIILMAESPRKPQPVLETIEKFKPTIFFSSPTSYASILATADFPHKYDLSSIRLCVSAGESLPAPIWHKWKDATGLDILDGVGSTEVGHVFISNRPDDIRPGSSGKPVPGYEVKIVDQDGNDVQKGEIGSLLVKGETTALYYLRQSERSRKTFLGEWARTGDQYYEDADGYFWHVGRSDDMLKVGGIWVSPVEVESALLSHPAILECVVVGKQDHSKLTKPIAYIVLKDTYVKSDLLKHEIMAHCHKNISDYKRPRWIEFVDELPKTPTGKMQRFKMREGTQV